MIVALMVNSMELPRPRSDSRLFEGFAEIVIQLGPLVEMHGHWMLSAGGSDHRRRFRKQCGIFREVHHAERRRHDDQLQGSQWELDIEKESGTGRKDCKQRRVEGVGSAKSSHSLIASRGMTSFVWPYIFRLFWCRISALYGHLF